MDPRRNVFPAMGNHISARIEEQTKQTETYSSRLQNKHLGHPFSAKEDRTGVGNAPPADSQLESELFLVLGDLERKLGQEQTESCMDTGAPSYASQGQFRNEYSTERGHGNIFADRTNYSDNSRTSFPDGTRTLTPSDEYKTHSTFRPKRFYEMYSNRHRTAPKHSYFQRQTSHEGPPVSSVPGGRSLNSSATFGNFSVRSLHLPSLRHSSFGFLQRGTQKESKRTPISSISWNTPLPNSHVENSANIYKAQSLMDLSNVKQDLQPTPLQQHRTYEFYRSQQNVHKAASSKVSRFGKVSHGQEEISQVSSNTSESRNCHQTVTDSALPTARELPCQDSVPMQTENIWDEGNKENCLDSDQYDSDTTLHSSDTMSDPEIELMATNNDEQQTTRPTRLACAERSSHHGSSPAASELPSQHGYSPAAPELPSQHGYSSDASEHPSQHGYSLAASELPSLHGYSLAASELPSLHGYSLAASELPSLHGYSLAASELPSLHGYSLAASELPSLHGYSLAASELPSQHGYSSDASKLPSQHGYSHAASELPSQHGYLPAASELPSLHGYSLSASELPSQHGYSSDASKLPSQHGYSPAASELPSQHGYSPAASELPSQHGYSPAAPELPSLHGYSLAASKLPSLHGYSPAASEHPSQHGYSPAAPELPSLHGYSLAASKLPSQHEYSPAASELPSQHGYLPAASELPSQDGYLSAAPELPSQHGYSPAASELPSQHGYSPAASELPSQHGYSPAASELPSQHGYSPAAPELPSLHGYSLAASKLPSLHGYSPAASEHPSQHGYSPAAPELPSLHGYSLAASELPSQHGYLPAASELPSQDGYLSAAPELPSQHGYSPAASKLCSHHGYPTPAISSATPMNVKCDLTPPFSENTADAHLLEDANDSGCIDTTTSIQHTPSNCSPAFVDIKETFSAATHHATDYSYQAESTEQPTSATIMVCPYGLKYQPQLRLTEVIHDNNGKTCQLDKKSDTPSPSNVQHEDNIQSASSTPPTEVSNHSRGLQSPTFSNSVIVMDAFLPGVTSAAGSRAARDQTKFSAQHWHPAMITHGTDVSRHKPWLPEPQVTTEKVTGNKPTSKICHNIDNASSLQAIYDDMVSSKTNHFQRSLNKSDATLHGSLPDISNAHVGLDPAHTVIFHKDASGQTSNCERIAHRNADKKVSRYTSILLHASSLPNLDQLQSFLLSSSESPEFKLENMQQTITDSRHAPNPQVQGQSTASRCKLIGDIASNLYLAQVTRVQDDEVISSTIKDTLEIHPALPTTHPQLSTESVLNPPPVFPPKNYYFACLDTPATSSLNRKNTDQPEVNGEPCPFKSSSKNGSSPESSQEQQIALCHDSSTNTSWSPNGNGENIYTASSPTICCTPTSASRAVVSENSKTDSAFFTVANGGTDQDRSNEQHPPASHPTHSMASKDVKPMKTSGLGVSDLAVGVSNVIQKPKSSKEQPATSAISQNLISIPETPETKNRTETTPQISDCNQTERERQAERLYLEHNVLPIRHMPSYDIAYECDESKSADTKTIHSTLAKHSSWPLSDLTARTLNNSITTESGNVYSPPTKWNETNNDFKICTTNSEAFVHSDQGKSYSTESFASCYELAQDKSASDTSVPLADKHVSVPVTSDTALFPSRRPLGDHLQAYTTSRKTAPPSSNHKHRSTVLDQDQPAIQATPFGINKENSLEKGDFTMPHEVNTCGTPTGTLRNYQIHPPDFTINASHKAQPHADVPIHLRKAGFFTSSDGLQGGKTLQEYKTKSTLSFTATEDKIEYHELVSVYYSLPLKHSKASSNMVLNHSYHREVPVSTDKNILSPNSILNRKQEFHIDLANTAYQIPRFFGRQLSTDSLSNVTAQQNENDINTTARHTPIRGISWNESEQHTLSPRRRHSTDNISPDLPLQAADLIFPDPIATYSSLHDRYSNALRKNQFQVVSDAADNRRDKTCNYLIPTNHEKREVLYSSPPLNSSSSLLPENDQVFLEHCPRAMNTSSQSQKMDLESRQEILQAKEDYNQNILQVNLTDTIDNSYQNGKTVSTTYDAQINPGEGLFTNGSPIQEKYTSDHTAVTKNRWDSVFLPASKQVILKGPVPEDLYGISSQIPFSLQPGLIDINAITVQHGLQNSKQGQLSPGNQPCTEFSGLQRYARPLGESHKLYSEDEAIGIPRELQTSPTAANPLFVYTTKNRCDKVKSNNEPSSTINWEQIYKTTNRRHSFQDSSRNPPPCKGPLVQRRSDSHVQPNKHKTVSPLSSPLQSLQESVNDNEVPTFSSDDGLTSLQKLNERNEELEASHISMSPVTNSKERTLNSRCTQKGNSYRSSSCTGPDPVQTLNHTKSSFFSKSFPNETARANHTQRLSSAFESPGEFSVPSPTVSDWLSNQERTIHGHDNPLLPFATDNYNSISHDHFQESVLPEHNSLHEWEIRPWEEDQHVHRSTKSLKNLNLQSRQSGFTDVKVKSDRRFSAITNVDKAYGRYPSSPALSNAIKYTRKSLSHSEVMSFDENDNWHPDSYGTTEYHPTRHFSTSPTVGFGIFGKEQQLAFLENIKRSLTEGRLWRPCFLKNPGFLRREADSTLNNTHFPNPSFDGSTITVQGMPPRETLNIYRDDPVLYSESDTDTTTDDEYYLDDFEKESEL